MEFKINEELIKLSNIFAKEGAKLFIVGGFVRDSLLKLNPTDIDLASEIKNEQLFKMLENTAFKVELASSKLGTTIIRTKDFKFEHTTFREESYKEGGFHSPEKVQFVKDLKLDAKRRDFTINSIYYDIQDSKIIDLFKGQKHLKKGVVKAIISPKYVFKSDGLRILRMIRIAGELDFKIANKTYKTAKKMITQLKDVSKERLFKEFELILNASFKYGLKKVKAVELLIKLNALEYIFPNLINFESRNNLAKLVHHLHYYNRVNEELIFEAFMLDLSLYLSQLNDTKSSVVATKLLDVKNTGISSKDRQFVVSLIKAYEQSNKLHDDYTARAFIQDHEKVINHLFKILSISKNKTTYELLVKNYEYMKQNNIPINLKQLKINGTILKEHFKNLDKKLIGVMLNMALKFCLLNKSNNTKAKILNFLDTEFNKEKKYD